VFDGIDPRSPTPLYEQIAARVRVALAAGELKPGQPLPSVRRLAASLRVNPATVVQAYRDLEGEGFVEMRQGAGTFVRDLPEARRTSERRRAAVALVQGLLADAARAGIPVEDLVEAFRSEAGAKVHE